MTGVHLVGPGSTDLSIQTVVSAEAVPGLTLVLPSTGGTFEPGTYRIDVLDAAGQPQSLTLCVGGPRSVRG